MQFKPVLFKGQCYFKKRRNSLSTIEGALKLDNRFEFVRKKIKIQNMMNDIYQPLESLNDQTPIIIYLLKWVLSKEEKILKFCF